MTKPKDGQDVPTNRPKPNPKIPKAHNNGRPKGRNGTNHNGKHNNGISKILNFEKLKAEIYREWVGRRNAFNLGNVKQGETDFFLQKQLKQFGLNALHNGNGQKLSVPAHVVHRQGQNKAGKGTLSKHGSRNVNSTNPLLTSLAHANNGMLGAVFRETSAMKYGINSFGGVGKVGRERKKATLTGTIIEKSEGKFGLTPEQIDAFREVFDLFDSNGGGTIDATELDETLRSVDITLAPEDINQILSDIDKNGNGEIDFDEFLQLMTNIEKFIEVAAGPKTKSGGKEREHFFFDALAQFMRKSALTSMDEIVGYYNTKVRRFQAPHVVGHYAAGARLIGLTEKQLYEHLERLKATNAGSGKTINSPYAQPLHFYHSTTKMGTNKLIVKKMVKKTSVLKTAKQNGRKKGKIMLKVNFKDKLGNKNEGEKGLPKIAESPNKLNEGSAHGTKTTSIHGHAEYGGIFKGGGWVSQRMDHVEIKLSPAFLKDIGDFDELTAEDLPNIRLNVANARVDYDYRRRAFQIARNLVHWRTLQADLISPEILRNHFQKVFSHYSYVPMKHLRLPVIEEESETEKDKDYEISQDECLTEVT